MIFAYSKINRALSGARFFILLSLIFLVACVSSPFSSEGVSLDQSPLHASQGKVSVGERVIWGGVVIASTNTASGSEIQLLSYPLDYLQRPDQGFNSAGTVLVKTAEYLETTDFTPGRRVTVSGQYGGMASTQVGESTRQSPVLETQSGGIHLWTASEYFNSTAVNVGISFTL